MAALEKRVVNAKAAESIRILHLSDLHFTHRTRFRDSEANGYDSERRDRFLPHLEEGIRAAKKKGNFEKYDLIFVTGDLADNSDGITNDLSHRQVLEAAKEYLHDLCQAEDIDPSVGLLVIPGNHDYRWRGNLFSKKARSHFIETFQKQFQSVVFDFNGFHLLVGCFDSNHVRFKKDFASFASGIVDLPSMADLGKELDIMLPATSTAFRMALVHHHPLPVAKGVKLAPQSWISRLFGKKLEGAPEFMLLRNSGTFLRKLFELDFQLVLHGHLHQRGYWRALTGEDGRWLEVISGGAAGTAEENQDYSFNSLEVHRDGFVKSTHFGFDSEGNSAPPAPVPTAPYEVCREVHWTRSENRAHLLRSNTYSKTWDVTYPEGDLVSSEMFLGLRSADGSPRDHIIVASSGDGLTQSVFHGESLSEGFEVTRIDPPPPPHPVATNATKADQSLTTSSATRPRIEYALAIHPPLIGEKSLDLVTKRSAIGTLFRSVEDQRRFGIPAEKQGTDGLSHKVMRPCERLLIRLRFNHDWDDAWSPETVTFDVEDDLGQPAPREADCAHVNFVYWSPQRLQRMESEAEPEAVLSVYRPRLGYTYRLRWKLEKGDIIPGASSTAVAQQREALRRLKTGGTRAPIANVFAESALETFRELRKSRGGSLHDDPKLRGFLYAFDEEQNELFCCGATGEDEDAMTVARFKYGRDIVGTAFRYRQAMGFNRQEFRAGWQLSVALPESIEFLFAAPLNWPTESGAAVGVIVLAATNRTSDLGHIMDNPDLADDLDEALSKLWCEKCTILGCR